MRTPTGEELLGSVRALPSVQAILASLSGEPTAEVFLVGGAVRDLLLGHEPRDLDFAVEGPLDRLAQALGQPSDVYERFGTATLTCDGVRCDLAQTRAESYAHPGALPQVGPADIVEDLRRRDFTVNAIALGLIGDRAGELIAVEGALGDLEARRLAVLHDLSFIDDPTRLLRLARYASRLGFDIAAQTRSLADAAISDGALATVSGARIGNELRLLAGEPDPIAAFSLLHTIGLDREIDPLLSFTDVRAALAHKALGQLPADGRADIVILATALLDAPATRIGQLLDRLEFTASDRDAIVEAATSASRIAAALKTAFTGSEVAQVIAGAGVAAVSLAGALGDPTRPQWWLGDLRHRTLQITGEDLLGLGISEGPAIGRALAAARDAMLNGEAPDREDQLQVALAGAE